MENRDYRIGTGFLSTPFVLKTLTEMGRADLAYRMLENEQQPGWLYEVNQGATTIWETWEGNVSRNHYSPGAVSQWLFDTVCGIKADGENHFTIAPVPGGSLTHAKASYHSLYGKVECGWKKTESGTHYTVSVPANTTVELVLTSGEHRIYSSGTYEVEG